MKIRKNENLFIFLLVLFDIALIFIISLAYFLGWKLNVNNFIIYCIIITFLLLMSLFSYLLFIFLNKSVIIFTDNEIIEINKNKETIIISYIDIWYSKYSGIFNTFIFVDGGGYLSIYRSNDEDNPITISISKRKLKLIKGKIKLL